MLYDTRVLYVRSTCAYVHKSLEEYIIINQEPHTSAATPPLLFYVASTINLVGHNILTSFVDHHKNISF